jgi:hemolysin D
MIAQLRPKRQRPAPPPLIPEALAFQAELDRLVAEPAPWLLRLWPAFGAGLVVALVLVAALARVDVVVTASGRIAADAPPVILQPAAGATLAALMVRPGDRVVQGQVLARLDPTLAEADRRALAIEAAALRARLARLVAERDGLDLPGGAGTEAALMSERHELARAQRRQYRAARDALAGALQAETAAGPALRERRAIAAEIAAMRSTLASRQTGSHLAALEARLAEIEADSAWQAHLARLGEGSERLAQAEAALAAFEADHSRQISEALAELTPRLAEVEERLARASHLAGLSALRAPRPGVVISVARGGPGSRMAEGEAVVVLVPTDVALVAEIGIRSAETGSIAPGDPVTLKIDAFPWRRHGMLQGRLLDVSHASFTPEGGTEALHSGRVSLTGELTELAQGTGLLPGMTLSAEIKTGSRTVLTYFLEPLMRGLSESLREP